MGDQSTCTTEGDADVLVVVLDFDGVVVASMSPQERAWRAAARAILKSTAHEEMLIHNLYAGKAREGMFETLDVSPEVRKQLRVAKDTVWLAERSAVPLMPGARETLPLLAQRYRVAIATTADRPYVEGVLAREGLGPYIAHIVTDADSTNPKPAPDMLVALANRFGVTVSRMCMVGDSESDEIMSRAGGCKFIRLGEFERPESPNRAANWRQLGQLLGVFPPERS